MGRKKIAIASITLEQEAETRTLNREDFGKFGFARAYAVRSITDIQEIK